VVVGYTGGVQEENLKREQALGLADRLPYCNLGVKAAAALGAGTRDRLVLRSAQTEELCSVSNVLPYGGQQDNQISVYISTAQRLAGLEGRLNSIQVIATGTPASINRFIASLREQIPEAIVRPIRQFTEGEAKIYNRISGLLTGTVAIVLLLTALCVMAAMTNVAMERKMDVGLMKAIGGATRRVVRLFLAEAALLGLAGGLIGAGAGILLSIGLGKAVFGVAARPRLIVYPVAVGLTVLVAILSAFPLRRLASIRPASVFRGEA
jgi:putative ABC transport system permease protein